LQSLGSRRGRAVREMETTVAFHVNKWILASTVVADEEPPAHLTCNPICAHHNKSYAMMCFRV
jgi:hypothetical protein